MEVNANWLPPLLTPIKHNRRLGTVPSIDNFEPDTFQAYGMHAYGDRGGKCQISWAEFPEIVIYNHIFVGIDWELIYRRFDRKISEGEDPLKPYPIPIMLGCAFAIDRKFFMEELDGYDREYKIWNGEFGFSLEGVFL